MENWPNRSCGAPLLAYHYLVGQFPSERGFKGLIYSLRFWKKTQGNWEQPFWHTSALMTVKNCPSALGNWKEAGRAPYEMAKNLFLLAVRPAGNICESPLTVTSVVTWTRSTRIHVQWDPSCEATHFAPEMWHDKRSGLSSGVEIITFMFRFTLSSGLSRGGGLSKGWPLKRVSTVIRNEAMLPCITTEPIFGSRPVC